MKSFTTILVLALSATSVALPTQPDTTALAVVVSRAAAATTASRASTSRASAPSASASGGTAPGAIDPSLVPEFGVVPNTNANKTQAGSCDGFVAATNSKTLIPCSCPPSRATFLAALARNAAAGSVQGTPVRFNNNAGDRSAATNRSRATAMLVTLQNLDGAGKGCPAASAPNFAVMQKSGAVSSQVFVGAGAA